MELQFSKPRRKCLNMVIPSPQLPISFCGSSSSDRQWSVIVSTYKNRYIYVESCDDSDFLWKNGCFGHALYNKSSYNIKSGLVALEEIKGTDNCNAKEELDFDFLSLEELTFEIDFWKKINNGKYCLLPEEAFFLSYALGCLVIKDESNKLLNIDEIWTLLQRNDPNFVFSYAVYHYFRCKNWIVKLGKKFGADWLLYPVGPSYYHAQYCVRIEVICANSSKKVSPHSLNSWMPLSALLRFNNHVAKTLVLCKVLRPKDLQNAELHHVSCLKKLQVQEFLINQWRPT